MEDAIPMTILASGSRQVRAMEVTLGGKLSKAAAKRPGAELARHVREQLVRRKAHRDELKPLLAQARAPLVELLQRDKRSAVSAAALRKAFTRRFKKPHAQTRHSKLEIEPRMIVGSGLTVKVPPYDYDEEWGWGEGHGSANGYTGEYTVQARGDGGAWAGVAANFLATENNPTQRFAALVDYLYSWYDWSTWGTAHNDASTHIWIWGFSENYWVHNGGNLDPAWSDGTSFGETHGSGGDGSWQSGRESLEVFFPAFQDHLYQAWVWSDGSCDDEGIISGASQTQYMSVPLMVFGGL